MSFVPWGIPLLSLMRILSRKTEIWRPMARKVPLLPPIFPTHRNSSIFYTQIHMIWPPIPRLQILKGSTRVQIRGSERVIKQAPSHGTGVYGVVGVVVFFPFPTFSFSTLRRALHWGPVDCPGILERKNNDRRSLSCWSFYLLIGTGEFGHGKTCHVPDRRFGKMAAKRHVANSRPHGFYGQNSRCALFFFFFFSK